MSGEAASHGVGDRTRTVLQMAPPAAQYQVNQDSVEQDGARWMKRFLNGEYDRWMSAKRLLNVDEDHVIVKVLLDFFQSRGGFDGGAAGVGSGCVADRQTIKWEPSSSSGAPELANPASPDDNRCDSPPSGADDPDEAPLLTGERSSPSPNSDGTNGHGMDASLKPTSVRSAVVELKRPAAELPCVAPQLLPLFSCGLCGAGGFASLAAHFEHLWSAHTELRMLGSAQRRRVPLKLRPHMFVLCALCGLNNRSTSTAGAADRHLTRAHLTVRHRGALQAASCGPLRFHCDDCEARCGSRAELALHVLDTGHGCREFVCEACGVEGEGVANARHHRLWHWASAPFQCYLCAERFATEPECVAHVSAEHAASFNVHRCARCPYATSTVGQFTAHARSHVGLNACVCHECGVMFQTAQSLRRHLMTHSRTEFRCQHCDRSFRHPLPLERHVRSQHLSPEDHKCGSCGKLFTSRYHLERHAMIHAGRRPHQCHQCGRRFVQKGDLARHVRKCRAGEMGEPPSLQVPAECPPPPIAPPQLPPPPIAPPQLPPPPQLQQAVLLQLPPPPVAMPLPAQ